MRGVLLGAQGRPLSKNLFQTCFLTLGNLSHELYYFFGTSQMWVLVFCAVVQVTYEIGPLTPRGQKKLVLSSEWLGWRAD